PTEPPESARSVVEATVRVSKYEVLEAMSPARIQSGVVVAPTVTPKLVATVNGAVPPLLVIAPQMMLPEASVVRALVPEQVPKRPRVVVPVLEIEKRVVVALTVELPTAKSVVAVSPLLACTESFANGEVDEIPRRPEVGVWSDEPVV